MLTDPNAYSKEKKTTFNGAPDNVNELWEGLKDKVRVEWKPQDSGCSMYDFAISDNNYFILVFGEVIKDPV